MQELVQRIEREARYLGNGIVRVDSFLNHKVDTLLLTRAAQTLAGALDQCASRPVTRVLTAETSGLVPALLVAQALGVPMVYARKQRPSTMPGDAWTVSVRSHTKGSEHTLHVAVDYLAEQDNVIIVDDVLGHGDTALALLNLVEQSGAHLCGFGFVIEKSWENGRSRLRRVTTVPILALADIDLVGAELIVRSQVHHAEPVL